MRRCRIWKQLIESAAMASATANLNSSNPSMTRRCCIWKQLIESAAMASATANLDSPTRQRCAVAASGSRPSNWVRLEARRRISPAFQSISSTTRRQCSEKSKALCPQKTKTGPANRPNKAPHFSCRWLCAPRSSRQAAKVQILSARVQSSHRGQSSKDYRKTPERWKLKEVVARTGVFSARRFTGNGHSVKALPFHC